MDMVVIGQRYERDGLLPITIRFKDGTAQEWYCQCEQLTEHMQKTLLDSLNSDVLDLRKHEGILVGEWFAVPKRLLCPQIPNRHYTTLEKFLELHQVQPAGV